MTATILPFVIRSRLGTGPAIVRKTSAGLLLARRTVFQLFHPNGTEKTVLLIFGCQRSGTTMLSQIFEGDARVTPFAEHSPTLARDDHKFRLRDLSEVSDVFDRSRGQLVIAKPLVESQRATDILEHFGEAKGLWVYRHYRDVVRSYVKLFGRAGVNIARRTTEGSDQWASQGVDGEARDTVARYYSEDMSLNDAAALFWWVRNGWYFQQHLSEHPRVALCRYARLVSYPDDVMRGIYSFCDVEYPGSHLVDGVHQQSKGLGASIELHPEIEALCQERLDALDSITTLRVDASNHD